MLSTVVYSVQVTIKVIYLFFTFFVTFRTKQKCPCTVYCPFLTNTFHTCAFPAMTIKSLWNFCKQIFLCPHNDIVDVISSSDWSLALLTVIFPRFPFAGENVYSYLNSHLSSMANGHSAVDLLGSSLHVWPDFHGNRSPLADPTLKGMVREHESRFHVT